jgi:hypothetical protein
MSAISDKRATDERVTCLRIFADASGETHMEDIDIALQPRKLFKDNPPLRLSDNFAASWFNICYVPSNMHEVDWHNPPQRPRASGVQRSWLCPMSSLRQR